MLNSWRLLPDTPLVWAGSESAALLRLGCRSFRDAARYLHALPYGRNSDRADYRLVLPEGRGTCSTKHALLAALAVEHGLDVSLMVGIYSMCEANTPGVGAILAAAGLSGIPEAHCYLRYRGDRIDVTRADAASESAIDRFEPEWSIEPCQIGQHKVDLHRRHLESWLTRHREVTFTLDRLWKIREDCIAALGAR